MPNWTKEQLDAINLEGKNIIVSAGAGSGKTAVLTERVIRKLKKGIHINELLVLTFTNAAAAEMKERIRKAIKKTEGLEKELELIDGSYITTFDSFSLSIVKKYHTKLNITNNVKITDEVIINIKKQEILDEILDEKYLLMNSNFLRLINDFCLKDDKDLKKHILNIYKKLELKYDKELYINNYINNYFDDKNIDQYINEYVNEIKKKQEEIKKLLISLNSYFDGNFITKINDSLKKLIEANTYEELLEGVNSTTSVRVPPKSDEEGKRIKSIITETVKEIKSLCIYESTASMKKEILETKNNQIEIINIIKELDKKLTEYKMREEIFNFNDIAHLAIKVVKENEDIRKELISSFNEILVDEYQDTSDTQEEFISSISNNNVYMVGDIKQSIYRFRNANPYIFKNKYDSYSNTDKGIKIDLNKNFRSRMEVLSNINDLFDLFMDDEIGGADYKASHRMIFGNNTYIEEGKTNQNYNLDVITYKLDKTSNITKEEKEIFIIGNDIKEKVKNKYQIFDKDTQILRDVKYSDFVILIDKSTNFNLYKKIFEYLQIPLSIMKDEALRKDDDILVIKNLLNLIICIKENRFDDTFKYSFVSVSRSFLYKTDDNEIFNYFTNNNFKDNELYKKCLELSNHLDTTSSSEFFYKMIEEFNYDEKLISIGNIKSNRIRCEYFYNLIKDFEQSGNTIYDFLDYLDFIFDNDYDLKFSINNSSSDSCKIMTIHKSKGLEFPICYFAGLTSRFNLSELKDKIIFDNKYGIVIPKVDEMYKNTICKTLLKINTKKEEISEKIRLLYVALTRAKEKMIFIIPELEEEQEVIDKVSSNIRYKYNSFLSIIKSIYTILLPFVINADETIYTKDYINITKENDIDSLKLQEDKLDVSELNFKEELIEESKFSKTSLHLLNKEEKKLLDFGTKVHQILEELDFNNPNLEELDIDNNIKNKIKLFLENNIIKNNLKSRFYKEYEFIFDDEKHQHGIIDLMIENENEIIIIDYKLKNIDDDAYLDQINGYKKVISKRTNKNISCYLYSIINNKLKKIS